MPDGLDAIFTEIFGIPPHPRTGATLSTGASTQGVNNDNSADEWDREITRLRRIEAVAAGIAARLREAPASPCPPQVCLDEAMKLVACHPDRAKLVWMLSEVFATLVGLPTLP